MKRKEVNAGIFTIGSKVNVLTIDDDDSVIIISTDSNVGEYGAVFIMIIKSDCKAYKDEDDVNMNTGIRP